MRKLRWLMAVALLATSAACDGRGYSGSSQGSLSPDSGYNYPSSYYYSSGYFNNVNNAR